MLQVQASSDTLTDLGILKEQRTHHGKGLEEAELCERRFCEFALTGDLPVGRLV